MSKKKNQSSTVGSEPQIDKFKRLAREVEADEDEASFDKRLRRIAKTKPKEEKAPDD